MSEDTRPDASNGKAKLIIRIAIFAILAVVVPLAAMDYRAKSAATKTANAWLGMVAEGDGLSEDQLEAHVVGSPEIAKNKDERDETWDYTWSGIIRDYRVEVLLRGHSESGRRHVSGVDGPINE